MFDRLTRAFRDHPSHPEPRPGHSAHHQHDPQRHLEPTRASGTAFRRRPLRAALAAVTLPAASRATRIAVAASVAGALTAGTAATYEIANDADVYLVVDAASRVVSTEDGTVRAALADAGVTVGRHDRIVPALGASVTHGDTITLVRAKDVVVSIDGVQTTKQIAATTVAEAIGMLQARHGAVVSASRSRRQPLAENTRIEVRNPQKVTVIADGQDKKVSTIATDQAGVLAAAGITVDADDLVTLERADADAAPETFVATGDVVRVVRVEVTSRVDVTAVPFTRAERQDPRALAGTRTVVQAGADGRVEKTIETTRHDGAVVAEKVVAENTVAPAEEVTAVGTKARPQPAAKPAVRAAAPVAASGRSSGLNWAALAQCESGGNPRAVSATGKYRGLYQFSMATWASVGGSGDPAAASAAEQTARAQMLYDRAGAGQWPHCGKRL